MFALLAIPAIVSLLSACTPAERATAGTVAQDVAAVAGSPIPCTTLTASGVRVGTACGTVSTVVSEVAQLVGTILAGLPPPSPGMRADAPPVAIVVRGVTVTLPAPMAEAVRAKIGGGA